MKYNQSLAFTFKPNHQIAKKLVGVEATTERFWENSFSPRKFPKVKLTLRPVKSGHKYLRSTLHQKIYQDIV